MPDKEIGDQPLGIGSESDMPHAGIRHDLATPISHIIGYSELLQDEAGEQGAAGLIPGLQVIQATGRRLLSIVNKNLDSTDLDDGNVAFRQLRNELPAPLELIISRTRRIIREAQDQKKETLVLDLQKIRMAAEQLLAFVNDGLGFAGIGAEQILSTKKPSAAPDTGPSDVKSEEPSEGGALHASRTVPATLLVVDDIEESRDILSRRLRRQGHTVLVARDGSQALKMIMENSFDLVLLDIMMPELNGYQVLEQLKADEVLRHIPVIVLSASGEIDSAVRCIELGAEDYLPRPFNSVLLRAKIGASLERQRLVESERKHVREQIRHAQKMESVGRLTGGVAHDFNNMLSVIISYADMRMRKLPPSDGIRKDLESILGAARRSASLTRQLLAFSRRRVIEPEVINLDDLVIGMHTMLSRLISEDIELLVLPASGDSLVKVDPSQIEQVMMNLAVNAVDAMPHGGKLTFETANATLGQEGAGQQDGVPAGEYVVLTVKDSGTGMTEEVKARIFEPFFTTKEAGKGTGLGLATCYEIVKDSGGYIQVVSELARGTTFKIYLLRVEEAAGQVSSDEGLVALPGGTERVLLVEDEFSLREVAASTLREVGYTVLEAASGSEALEVAREHSGEKIHLILTDVVMPQMGGKELAIRLRDADPKIKVLYTSGYPDSAPPLSLAPGASVEFLEKPFSATSLLNRVREVLDHDYAETA